ncbi:MAG: ABC transporter permease [Clostridia bacterium]|nr:ABC transporter permease [Clostridia bacterium]
MRRLWMWFLLLNKRLYKKATFVILLLLIPLMILALNVVAQQDSGFVTIALAQDDPADAVSSEIVSKLISDQRVIRFVNCETSEAAQALVSARRADAAWVFPDAMQERLETFLKTRRNKEPVVTVFLREETVPLLLSHEKLAGALYKQCAPMLYRSYARGRTPELDGVSDEKLMSYYHGFEQKNALFQFAYPDETVRQDGDNAGGYLVTPLRGLLSIFVLLGGLAAAMFYMQDERRGVFSWVKQSRLTAVSAACQGIAVLNLSVVMLLSLLAIGMTVSLPRELVLLVLYILCCTAFCSLLSQLCRCVNVLGMVTPPLIVCMVVICPVFFNLGALRRLQFLFPPTYYLNAVHSDRYIVYGVVYCVICAALSFLLSRVRKKG